MINCIHLGNSLNARLPSLHAIRAFEAVARHKSFTDAAQDLNVLQPAVSRQIAILEEDLGTALFLRKRPKLALTPAGETLFAAVTGGFEQIASAASSIRDRHGQQTIVINASIAFASQFLMTRLANFNSAHPDVELELVTSDLYKKYDPRDFDVAIVFGDKDSAPGREAQILIAEELIAVCAPSYLGERPPLNDEDLVQERLLHLHDPNHLKDWERFLSDTAIQAPASMGANRYTAYMVYLQAALNGEGIELGWSGLLDDLIDAGKLRLASNRRVRTQRGFFCCISERGLGKQGARDFASWLISMKT